MYVDQHGDLKSIGNVIDVICVAMLPWPHIGGHGSRGYHASLSQSVIDTLTPTCCFDNNDIHDCNLLTWKTLSA